MVVLGLDLSIRNTGVCMMTEEFLETRRFFSCTIQTHSSLSLLERILLIEQELKPYIALSDLVVIENYAYGTRFQRETLAELHGVIKRHLYLHSKPFLLQSPSRVKKILNQTARRPKESSSQKTWTLENTAKLYGIDFGNRHHECDAFGLALLGIFSYLLEYLQSDSLAPFQRELAEKIKKENADLFRRL